MLLSRSSLAVVAVASDELARPQLNGVHVAPDGTCTATDGHRLIRVGPVTADAADFPACGQGVVALPAGGFILPSAAAREALKSIPKGRHYHFPILQHVKLAELAAANGVPGRGVLVATDLDTTKRTEFRPLEGPYPNCDAVIPKGEPVFRIGFNLALLAEVCATLGALSADRLCREGVLEFHGPLSPCVITVSSPENGQPVTALVMPLKVPDRPQPEAPDAGTAE